MDYILAADYLLSTAEGWAGIDRTKALENLRDASEILDDVSDDNADGQFRANRWRKIIKNETGSAEITRAAGRRARLGFVAAVIDLREGIVVDPQRKGSSVADTARAYPFAGAALTTEAVTEFELANGSGASFPYRMMTSRDPLRLARASGSRARTPRRSRPTAPGNSSAARVAEHRCAFGQVQRRRPAALRKARLSDSPASCRASTSKNSCGSLPRKPASCAALPMCWTATSNRMPIRVIFSRASLPWGAMGTNMGAAENGRRLGAQP